MNSKKQGNGLIVVLIILSALAFGVYSVFDLVDSEFRLNKRAELYNEAKQAAESIVQAGVADIHIRLENSVAVRPDILSPTVNPLSISDEFLGFHGNEDSNLDIPSVTQYSNASQFFTQNTEIIGGRFSDLSRKFIDPNESGNERDPQAGLTVFSRTVEVFGKASASHPVLGTVTVFASQHVEVREIPLFSYAIYYNVPMEIAPGPKMDVYGNVHVNGDAWFQSGNGLDFHGRVTIAGDINHGRHPDSGMGSSGGAVNFTNNNGDLLNMKKNDLWPAEAKDLFSGTWLDSVADNFRELSDQIWNGNLLTKDDEVKPIRLPGVSDYIEDTDDSTPGKQSFNGAYSIIQPALDEIDIPLKSEDPEGYERASAAKAADKNKFSYMAALTIDVAEDGSVSYYSYDRDSYNNIKYDDDRSPKKIPLTPSQDIANYEPYSAPDGTVEGGLYDTRQGENINLVALDVSKLKDLVDGNAGEDWGGERPEDWWKTGVVYVKFPQQNAESDRPDGVNPAKSRNWGVKLVNGQTIPNPTFAQNRGVYGTSIATNQVMYVEGHYNSDGNLKTGSPTTPDNSSTFNQEGQEAPAALAADAITFLSAGWDDSNSKKGLSNRIAQPTEVSAAILTGLVPSGETGPKSYSGGVENFPRFLEKWSGKDFVMRGSIVAMFESEVATSPWGSGGVYAPPRREWGFHQNYIETPPPGPRITTYRGRDLQILTQNEYETRVNGNNW